RFDFEARTRDAERRQIIGYSLRPPKGEAVSVGSCVRMAFDTKHRVTMSDDRACERVHLGFRPYMQRRLIWQEERVRQSRYEPISARLNHHQRGDRGLQRGKVTAARFGRLFLARGPFHRLYS